MALLFSIYCEGSELLTVDSAALMLDSAPEVSRGGMTINPSRLSSCSLLRLFTWPMMLW